MKLTVTSASGDVFPIEIQEDMELENFLALCQAEISSLAGFSVENLCIVSKGIVISDLKKSLKDCGLNDNDLIIVGPKQSAQNSPRRRAGGAPTNNPLSREFLLI